MSAAAEELVGGLLSRGVRMRPDGDHLEVDAPIGVLTPGLVEALREHKAAILRILEQREAPAPSAASIGNAHEVLEMARARFGLRPEDREEAPLPWPERGRDPLVQRRTEKARFFRDVRRRDLEERAREGLPPWIRLVGGEEERDGVRD